MTLPQLGQLLSDEQLTQVADRVREILRQGGLARTIAIGQLVMERFYAGNEQQWRARRTKKNNSLRRLAARPDCPLGKSALNEAVGIYVAARTLPMLSEARHIGAGHIASVLRLDQASRERWLQRAEREQLSVRALRGLLVDARRAEGERRGRPASPWVTRVAGRIRCLLNLLEGQIDSVAIADCDPRELEALFVQLDSLRKTCERVLALGRARWFSRQACRASA